MALAARRADEPFEPIVKGPRAGPSIRHASISEATERCWMAAMIWVGGGIIVHGLEQFGAPMVGHAISSRRRNRLSWGSALERVCWLARHGGWLRVQYGLLVGGPGNGPIGRIRMRPPPGRSWLGCGPCSLHQSIGHQRGGLNPVADSFPKAGLKDKPLCPQLGNRDQLNS